MAKLPSIIKVGPFRYRVRTDKDAVSDLKSDRIYGIHRSGNLTITVDPDYPHDQVADTLVHEILHAIWHVVALPREKLVNHQQEDIIDALSSILLGVLRDNHELVTYLTEWSNPDN